MYNNISLELEKKALKDSLKYFNPQNKEDMRIYVIFEKLIKDDVDAKAMAEELRKLGDLEEYNKDFRTFVDTRIGNLELLEKQAKEIVNLKSEIVKENQELEKKLEDRNVRYDNDIEKKQLKEKDLSTTFLEEKKSKEELEKDLELLKDKNDSIEKEKKTGEEFDEKADDMTKSEYMDSSTHNEQMEKIQEDAYNNTQFFNNVDAQDIVNYYNYYLNSQDINSKFNATINYVGSDRVEIIFSHKGNKVNEKIPSTTFVYMGQEQMDYYYNEVYPYLIDEHIIDSQTNTVAYENHLESINSNDETLEVNGDPEEIEAIKEDMDKTLDRKKGIARKKEFILPVQNNDGLNNKGIFIVVIVAIVTICVALFLLNM